MNNKTKKCPYCAEEIKDEAIKCRYCHSDLKKEIKLQEKRNKKKSSLMFYVKYYIVYFLISYIVFSIANDDTIGLYFIILTLCFPLPFFVKWNEYSEKRIKEKNKKKVLNDLAYTPKYNTNWEFLNMFKKRTITRLEFFIWNIPIPVILIIIGIALLDNYDKSPLLEKLFTYYLIFGTIFWFVIYAMSTGKRFADLNKTGNIVLLALIPSVNIIVFIYLLSKEGNRLKY